MDRPLNLSELQLVEALGFGFGLDVDGQLEIRCGPLDGLKHYGKPRDVLAYHLARARWALYEVGEDGRAWYRGIESSEANARRKGLKLRTRSGNGYIFGSFHALQRIHDPEPPAPKR